MLVLATAARNLGRRTDAECGYTGLIAALRAADIQVEQGMVAENQNLSRYDLVLVEVPNPSMVNSDRFAGAMWALHGKTAPAVAIYDHWNIKRLHTILARLSKTQGFLGKSVTSLLNHQTRTAINAFPWGNRKGFEWVDWCFDPSMMMTAALVYRDKPRERKWVFATYEDHRKWIAAQEFEWPLEEYGRMSHGRKMIDLPNLISRYTECWGAIVPPYPDMLGSGYWRNRFVHMAQTRSLIYADQEDVPGVFNTDYLKMDEDQLRVEAEKQSRWFFDNCWNRNQFIREAKKFVEEAAG